MQWHSVLLLLRKVNIPRAYFSASLNMVEIPMFGDNSREFFSARLGFCVIFCQYPRRQRLVLCLERLLWHRWKAFLHANLKSKPLYWLLVLIKTIESFWTFRYLILSDSSTVLRWLRTDDQKPVFAANSVSEYLESTTVDELYHLKFGDTSADTGTHRIAADAVPENCWATERVSLKLLTF